MTFRKWITVTGAVMLLLPLSEAAAADAKKTDPGEKLVCKNRQRTGTRFATKICRTVTQWDRTAEENQRGFKETVDRPQVLVCGPQTGC